MTCGREQQPRNGLRVRCVLTVHDFSHYFASIGVLPRGSPKVLANGSSSGIEEIGFRRFEDPGELLVRPILANINLKTRCMRPQNDVFRRGNRQFLRHLGPRGLLRNRE